MAVYERRYRGYQGERTPMGSRFLVIPRFAYRQVFSSKLFVVLFVLCFVFPIGAGAAIYIANNLHLLANVGIPVDEGFSYQFGGEEAVTFLFVQGVLLGLLVALIVGPALISNDLQHGGLPLYLSRPLTRSEYILGKLSVLAFLLSLITWVPGLLLFGLQSILAGWEWTAGNLNLALALFLGSWIWILILSLISLSISAFVKWSLMARAALFAVFLLSAGLAETINGILRTRAGSVLSIPDMIRTVWFSLFDVDVFIRVPVPVAWASLLAVCAVCLALLYRKIRPFEVVR
jgi:ABC-2 type transport system permease protein